MGFIKLKNVENTVFFHFLHRKTPFNVFCVAFRQISRLARSFAQSSTDVHSLALSRRKTRPLLELLAKKDGNTVLRRISADLAPCSVVRSVEYGCRLPRSLPSQNATSARTARKKGRAHVFASHLADPSCARTSAHETLIRYGLSHCLTGLTGRTSPTPQSLCWRCSRPALSFGGGDLNLFVRLDMEYSQLVDCGIILFRRSRRQLAVAPFSDHQMKMVWRGGVA